MINERSTIKAALLLIMAGPAWAQSTARIVGCAKDATDQGVPGVTIFAKAKGVEQTDQQTVETDHQGCYELELPPNSYRVTAHLRGFDNVTHEINNLAPGDRAPLDFAVRVSSICECVMVVSDVSLTRVWQVSETVFYLRVSDHDGELAAPKGYFKQTADVLEVLKGHSGPATTFLEYQGYGYQEDTPPPHDIGEELVMFLGSDDQPGYNSNTLFIREGRVHAAPDRLSRYVGVGLSDVLFELHTLARAR